jgi:hypothetical protein
MKFITTIEERESAKRALRDAICDVFEKPEFRGLDHMAIAETLVASAFAWCDFNGGDADVRHAAKRLHEMVNEIEAKRFGR